MFTVETLAIGALAALLVGVSKTGMPGAGLVSIPLFASIVDGRLIPGTTLPVLIVADLFAVAWYRQHARWDVMRPLAPWIGLGYAAGSAFFIAVGSATGQLEVTIGVIVLGIVALQTWRMIRRTEPRPVRPAEVAAYGTTGGFTTFVANAAGPVLNSYLVGLRLDKHELMGTSAWMYLALNLSKIPFYVGLGAWTDGGAFFTGESLLFNLVLVPAILVGVYAGRALFHRIPQQTFVIVVLALSALGAVRLIV